MVSSIVGAGIFLVSPYVAADVGSPWVFLATWVLGGAIALSGALSNGELGGMFPRSGGEYVYLSEAYGPAFGFLSGWTSFWIGFPGSIAALAAGFGDNVGGMLGLGPRASTAIGIGSIVVLTAVNALGLRPGKFLVNALTGTKLAAFAVLLALGVLARQPAALGATASSGGVVHAGMAMALIPVLFAYSGWNAATYVSGEMRDPRRGLGRALALGTAICVVLYVAVNATYLRALPLPALSAATNPAHDTALRLGGEGAARLLSPLVAVCVLSSLQATVLVGPRVYHAMAQDRLFFKPLARVHGTTGVPVVALSVQAVVSILELLTGGFDKLLTFSMFAVVAFSTLTVAAVFVLRLRRPEGARPFRVPGYPLVPALFVVVNAWVLWSVLAQGAVAALVGVGIVATGIPAYAAFRAFARAPLQPQEPPLR